MTMVASDIQKEIDALKERVKQLEELESLKRKVAELERRVKNPETPWTPPVFPPIGPHRIGGWRDNTGINFPQVWYTL
jgi:hypothetical protein